MEAVHPVQKHDANRLNIIVITRGSTLSKAVPHHLRRPLPLRASTVSHSAICPEEHPHAQCLSSSSQAFHLASTATASDVNRSNHVYILSSTQCSAHRHSCPVPLEPLRNPPPSMPSCKRHMLSPAGRPYPHSSLAAPPPSRPRMRPCILCYRYSHSTVRDIVAPFLWCWKRVRDSMRRTAERISRMVPG